MRKIIFVLLIAFSLNLNAQIQRSFYGFSLGKTTKKEVVSYFKSRKMKIWNNDTNRLSVRSLNFGGYKWPVVYFNFYKNKLYLIYFSDAEYFTPRQSLDTKWKDLEVSLMSKYRNVIVNEENTEEYHKFIDHSQTSLIFKYDYYEGYKGIALMYTDLKLQYEQYLSEKSEL